MKKTYDEIGPWPMEIHYITDKGATFDDHFDDAFKQIFDMGYEHIVSVGGDIPTMPKSHVTQAFQWLDYFQAQGTPGFRVRSVSGVRHVAGRLFLQHRHQPSGRVLQPQRQARA